MAENKKSKLKDIKKIGVYIGVPGLGDLLFIIPLFRALKEGFPGSEVVFIGKLQRDYVIPVFKACPYIDDILEFHFYEHRSLSHYSKFVSRLRKEKFDLLVDTQRKAVPSMLLKMGGARFMVSDSTNGVFSDFKVPPSGDRSMRHTSDISLDLARAVGVDPILELSLHVEDENIAYADSFYTEVGVAPDEPLLGLVTSAGEPTRCWPVERFAEVADRLHASHGLRPVCFGSVGDREIIENFVRQCKAPVVVEDLTHGNILDSAALMKRCFAMLGNVSGPLHVADAVGLSVVGIYGPHPPGRFGLLGPRTKMVYLNRDCSPCQDPQCSHRKCIMDISVEQVEQAVIEVLDSGA